MALDVNEAKRLARTKQSFEVNGTRKVSIITEGKRLAELGREPMLYLNFILITAVYLLLLCAIHAPHMYFYYKSSDTESNVFYRLSMANWDQTASGPVNLVLAILEVVSCIVTIAYIRFMYWYIKRANNQGNLLSIGDFAVHIRHVPKSEVAHGVTRLVNYFSNFGKVVSCVMALDTGNINKLKEKRAYNERMMARCDARIEKSGRLKGLYPKIKRLYFSLRNRVVEKDLNYHLAKEKYQCTGDVYLVYSTELERYKCLHAFNKPLCQRLCSIGGAKFLKLKVEPAMEPEDIIWENLEYSTLSKYTRRGISVLMTVIFMVFVCAASGVLEWVRENQFKCENCGVSDVIKTKDLKNNVAWTSYGISVLVNVIVSVQGFILFYLSIFEKHRFRSHLKRSLMYKLSFSALLIIIAMAVVYLKFDDEQPQGLIPWFFYINGYKTLSPLVEGQMFYYNIFNALLIKIVMNLGKEFLLPFFHFFKRWYKARNSETQEELNEAYTPPKYSYPYRYANQLKVIVIALAFGGLFPLVFYMATAGLILSYVLDKFNIIYVYQSGFKEEDVLCTSAVNTMTFAFLFRYILVGITHIYRLLSAKTSVLNFFVITWIISTALYLLFILLQFSVLDGAGFFRKCCCCSSYRYPSFVTPDGRMSCVGFHLSKYEPPVALHEVNHVYTSKKNLQMKKVAPPPRQSTGYRQQQQQQQQPVQVPYNNQQNMNPSAPPFQV